jgi:hypothetical protein
MITCTAAVPLYRLQACKAFPHGWAYLLQGCHTLNFLCLKGTGTTVGSARQVEHDMMSEKQVVVLGLLVLLCLHG